MQIDPVSLSAEIPSVTRKSPATYADANNTQAAPDTAQKPERKVDRSENVAKLQSTLSQYNISMRIHKDDRTNRIIVNLVDDNTGESVLQIPSEVSLKLAADFIDMQRNFVDQTN